MSSSKVAAAAEVKMDDNGNENIKTTKRKSTRLKKPTTTTTATVAQKIAKQTPSMSRKKSTLQERNSDSTDDDNINNSDNESINNNNNEKRQLDKQQDQEEEDQEEDDELSLFALFSSPKVSPQTIINDWISDYQKDSINAMMTLINFVLESTGCKGTIVREMIEDQDMIQDTLADLQESFDHTTSDYPIRKKPFRKKYLGFWEKWIQKIKSHGHILVDNDEDDKVSCLDLLKSWLVTMSSSTIRAFRHTSTLVLLTIFTQLAKEANKCVTSIEKQTKQLDGAKRESNKSRIKSLGQSINEQKIQKEVFEEQMTDLFTSVFVHRYRDYDSAIRTDCIQELGKWISTYPTVYLDPQYLRYLGWMLFDKVKDVRLESIKALSTLYSNDSMITGLLQFTERFKSRLLEMANFEKDSTTRLLCIQVCIQMSSEGFLEDDEMDSLIPLLFEGKEKNVSSAVAEHFVQQFNDDTENRLQEELLENEDLNDTWVKYKVLVEQLVKYSKGVGKAAEKSKAMSQTLDSLEEEEEDKTGDDSIRGKANNSQNDEEGEDNLNETEVEILKHQQSLLARSLPGTNFWCDYFQCEEYEHTPKYIGFDTIYTAIQALEPHLDLLADWKSIFGYLSLDFSANVDLEKDDDIQQRDNEIRHYGLNDEEEYVLLLILSSLVKYNSIETKKGKNNNNNDDERDNVSRELMKYLPKLLVKYSKEYSPGYGRRKLVECILMVMNMNLGLYQDLRMLKEHQSLLNDITSIFKNHSSLQVLQACQCVFEYLAGITEEQEQQQGGEDQKSEKVKHVALFEDAKSLFVDLANQVIPEIKDLESEVKTEITEISTNDISLEQYFDKTTFDRLRVSLLRLFYLGQVVDLSEITIALEEEESQEEEELTQNVFEVVYDVVNVVLDVLKYSKVDKEISKYPLESNETLPTPTYLRLSSESILEYSMSVIHVLSIAELKRQVDKKKNGEVVDSSVYRTMADHLIKMTEAIVVGNSEDVVFFKEKQDNNDDETMYFSLPLQLCALGTLCDMYTYRNTTGTVVDIKDIVVEIPSDIPSCTTRLTCKMVDLFCFKSKYFINNPDIVVEIGTVYQDSIREKVLDMLTSCLTYSSVGIFELKDCLGCFLSCFGIQTIPRLMNISSFGVAWDKTIETLLDKEFGVCVDGLVGDGGGKRVVDFLSLLSSSVEQALYLYYSGRIKNQTSLVRLTKLVVGYIKRFSSSILNGVTISSQKKRLLGKGMLKMLQDGCEFMVTMLRIVQKSSLGDDDDGANIYDFDDDIDGSSKRRKSSETKLFEASNMTKSMVVVDDDVSVDWENLWGRIKNETTIADINFGWKLWGSIGGSIKNTLDSLDISLDNSSSNTTEMSSVEDVSEYTTKRLNTFGMKPIERGPTWVEYFTFQKALEKGDSNVGKRGGGARKTSNNSNSSTKVTRTKKKPTTKKPRKSKKHDLDDDENFVIKSQPTRKSSRRSRTAVESYKDDVDDDIQEGNDRPAKRSKVFQGGSDDERSSDDDDDGTEENDGSDSSSSKRNQPEDRSPSPEILRKKKIRL